MGIMIVLFFFFGGGGGGRLKQIVVQQLGSILSCRLRYQRISV